MPRCSTHCPPKSSGPLLPTAIIVGVFAIAATWTVIVHVLTILAITLGVIAGLGVIGLTAVMVVRLRGLAREPRVPARNLPAPAGGPRTIRAAAVDQRQITRSRTPAADCQQSREAEHRAASAIEQHWHLHVHGTSDEQLPRILGHTPGRTPGSREQARAPRDGGGRHNA
jgi:hypothetical protein